MTYTTDTSIIQSLKRLAKDDDLAARMLADALHAAWPTTVTS